MGNLEYEVAIAGGGLAGIIAALSLIEEGQSVAVIESRRIAEDITGYTTAKITSLHSWQFANT